MNSIKGHIYVRGTISFRKIMENHCTQRELVLTLDDDIKH